MIKPSTFALAASIGLSVVSLPTAAASTVTYQIDLTEPEHHTGAVKIEFPGTDAEHIDVMMPAWRTGLYRILDLANGVREFSATNSAGEPLAVEKIDKSTWRIELDDASATTVSYQVYANQLGRRSRHIDDSHAYLDASAVFMYAEQWRHEPIVVDLTVPEEWRSVSGMASEGEHQFTAANWDILVDSPIETGLHTQHQFTQDGRDYEVIFWGDGNYDEEQTVADLQKLVQQGPSIWSAYPYERYVFMIHATDDARGATEHLNSTVIQRTRYSFAERDDYLSFMSTASHEFVHTWNVKAYRPDGLVPYEYQHENYTDLLWIAEGSTSYFQDHLLLRAGVMEPDEYFKNLARSIAGNQKKPGKDVMSVAEASFEAWIDEYGDRAHNFSVNIYSEGALVSWALDLALLEQTDGEVSYRDVHDALYQRFDASEQGFTSADVKAILRELTGQNWSAWWEEHVTSPVALDFDTMLAAVGLEIAPREEQELWAGWQGEATENGIRLTAVDRHSPAWEAGFTPGDHVVAINGQRATLDRLTKQLAEQAAEHESDRMVTVQLFRRDQLEEKQLTLVEQPKGDLKVQAMAEPSKAQSQRFYDWLGIAHPNAD